MDGPGAVRAICTPVSPTGDRPDETLLTGSAIVSSFLVSHFSTLTLLSTLIDCH